ncbi:hypothetical protein NDU88_006868 [Pleurodeles waltl]|uniref:Uncharacterized protein n=1 Tax=Pleurodeles waltl TaxID=8319 RepID=A0AAV7RRD4_PLEWA|nr:hypothetical protein NDU88_006868 [Pleurodeles waltl]
MPTPAPDMHLLCGSSSTREVPRRVRQPTSPAIIPQLKSPNHKTQAPQGTPPPLVASAGEFPQSQHASKAYVILPSRAPLTTSEPICRLNALGTSACHLCRPLDPSWVASGKAVPMAPPVGPALNAPFGCPGCAATLRHLAHQRSSLSKSSFCATECMFILLCQSLHSGEMSGLAELLYQVPAMLAPQATPSLLFCMLHRRNVNIVHVELIQS